MPYNPQHRALTRARIVESARILFNRHGFEEVTIDMVMAEVGLTRGGFYYHFSSKEALYAEAVLSFLHGRGAQWREEAGVDPTRPGLANVESMIAGYLSPGHLGNLDAQCPMIALPSDVARGNPEVRNSYQILLSAMVGIFESGLEGPDDEVRRRALSLAALCVGGMVLARTLPEPGLADELRQAAFDTAIAMALAN